MDEHLEHLEYIAERLKWADTLERKADAFDRIRTSVKAYLAALNNEEFRILVEEVSVKRARSEKEGS